MGILPIVWRNGWPIAGENVKPGTYEIQSERRGFGLELAVDLISMPGGGGGFGGRVGLQFDGHDAGMVFAATLGLFLHPRDRAASGLTL